ncbi:MAG: WYL domain-containing protein, partial [Treponema sp.]|nr:WYL domain-containing protein [Treponema sp.]
SRQFVKSCIWADDQKVTDYDDEGRTQISFTSTQSLKIFEWVLSQGSNARPVSPEWFVQNWKNEIRAMAESL